MKKINSIMLTVLAICFAACGSNNGDDCVTLKTETDGLGYMTDYASFSDEVKIKKLTGSDKSENSDTVMVNLSLYIDVSTAFSTEEASDITFTISIADQDHATIVDKFYTWHLSYNNSVKSEYIEGQFGMIFNVYKGKITESKEIALTVQEWEAIKEKGTYLIISAPYSEGKIKPINNGGSNSSVSSINNSDNDSEDWDEILDSYERCVDKYISLSDRAASGDASIMSEYTELMEESQKLSNKLSKAKSNLSSSQASRYMEITQKMASVAQ